MSKKSPLAQSPRHVLIFDEDWEWLRKHYGKENNQNAIGTGVAIRTVVHAWIQRNKAKTIAMLDQSQGGEN